MYKQILSSVTDDMEHMIIDTAEEQLNMEDAFIICFLLQGDCYVKCHSNTRHLHTNDVFFFPPNIPYSVTCHGKNVSWYQMNISRKYLHLNIPFLETIYFEHFHITPEINPGFYQVVCHCLAGTLFSGLNSKDIRKLKIFTDMNALLLSIYQEFQDSASPRIQDSDYVSERIGQILSFIREHYTEKINMEDVSAHVGLHPQYFSIFFQKHFHEKFTDYLNRHRVNSSLSDLLYTDKSLLEIALDHGFQSNKSYSNSFQKYMLELPSAYRNRHREDGQPAERQGTDQSLIQKASYLYHNHWTKNFLSPGPHAFSAKITGSITPLSLELDLEHLQSLCQDNRIRIIGVGACFSLLQEDTYEQLKKAKKECGFTHVYIRDIFGDLLNVYSAPEISEPVIYWGHLDRVIRRIIDLDLIPYIEFGYMPTQLADKNYTLNFRYHPNVSMPKSMSQWQVLVHSFLVHYRSLYREKLLDWVFDFWSSANLTGEGGYWRGTKEEFFSFFKATWDTFQSVDPRLQMGSPNFSVPDGIQWYRDFFEFCQTEQIRLSHISVHLYSCLDDLEHFRGIFPYPPTTYNYLSLTGKEYLLNILHFLKSTAGEYGFQDLPIIASEWNITYYLNDLIRDTAFMATYIAHIYISTLGSIKGMSFSFLSDNADQSRPSNLIFDGNAGLIDKRGIPKAAYYAFRLLHRMDRTVIAKGSQYLVTKSSLGYHVLLFNMSDYEKTMDPDVLGYISHDHRYQIFRQTNLLKFHGILHVPEGSYDIRRYTLDQEHGSVYDTWIRMGRPDPLTDDVLEYMRNFSVPDLHCSHQENTNLITLECNVNPHGVILFEIERNTDISPDARYI